MAGQPPQQAAQGLGAVPPVVEAGDHGVFKRNPPACGFKIISAGADQLRQRVFVVDRHNLAPYFVRGRVEGNRERQLQFQRRQVVNPGDQAAGG